MHIFYLYFFTKLYELKPPVQTGASFMLCNAKSLSLFSLPFDSHKKLAVLRLNCKEENDAELEAKKCVDAFPYQTSFCKCK